MATKNTEATRYYSDMQEKRVVKKFGGFQTANSGAGAWTKGDVIIKDASLMVECKTPVDKKNSISIKKEWIDKNREEIKQMQLQNQVIAITFEPNTENYFLIDERLMGFLLERLKENNN